MGRYKFSCRKKEWKTFEKNNRNIALNILSVPYNQEDIITQYKSKYNFKRKNQVVLLMITGNKRKWHYLALKTFSTGKGYMDPKKSISKLFRRFSSKHDSDFYCMGCLKKYIKET